MNKKHLNADWGDDEPRNRKFNKPTRGRSGKNIWLNKAEEMSEEGDETDLTLAEACTSQRRQLRIEVKRVLTAEDENGIYNWHQDGLRHTLSDKWPDANNEQAF